MGQLAAKGGWTALGSHRLRTYGTTSVQDVAELVTSEAEAEDFGIAKEWAAARKCGAAEDSKKARVGALMQAILDGNVIFAE